MEESKLERSAVRSLLLLSKEERPYFQTIGEIDRWEPLRESNVNVVAKPPRPQTKCPRRPLPKHTPEPLANLPPTPIPLATLPPTPEPVTLTLPTPEPCFPLSSDTPLPEVLTQTTDSHTTAPTTSRENSAKASRRTSVDLSVVQMPPPAAKPRRALQSYRNSPISIAPIPRPLSLSVREVQRTLSENTRKYRVGSQEGRLVKLRGRLSFHSYVALKT